LWHERASRVYLYAVAASLALTLLAAGLLAHLQVTLPAMLLELLTLPWTPLLWRLFAAIGGLDPYAAGNSWTGWSLTMLAAALSACVNAVVVGRMARSRRRRVAPR
jgi:hypothetical protein